MQRETGADMGRGAAMLTWLQTHSLFFPRSITSHNSPYHSGPPATSPSAGSKHGFSAGCHSSLSNNYCIKVLLCITFERGLCSQAGYEVPHLITQDGQSWAQRSNWFQYRQPATPAPARAGKPSTKLHQHSPEQCSSSSPTKERLAQAPKHKQVSDITSQPEPF